MNKVSDYIMFPINNISDLAEVIANLSDEEYELLLAILQIHAEV